MPQQVGAGGRGGEGKHLATVLQQKQVH
jgi:hypothetical protein